MNNSLKGLSDKALQELIDNYQAEIVMYAKQIEALDVEIAENSDDDVQAQRKFLLKKSAKSAKAKHKAEVAKRKKAAKKKAKEKAKAAKAKAEAEQRAREAAEKQRQANLAAIQQKIKNAQDQFMAKTTKKVNSLGAVYCADLSNQDVVMLFQVSPNESTSNTNAVHPTPDHDQRINYSVRTDKTFTGTFTVYGPNLNACLAQYNTLLGWEKAGKRMVITGFANWQSGFFQTLGKSLDQPYANALTIELTVQSAQVTNEQITVKQKPHGGKSKGKKSKGKKYVRIKRGYTYWYLAKKYHKSIASLEKLNHNRKLIAGKKVRVS